MNFALFDIEGTLFENLAPEDACYVHALEIGLGHAEVDHDWNTYGHVKGAGG